MSIFDNGYIVFHFLFISELVQKIVKVIIEVDWDELKETLFGKNLVVLQLHARTHTHTRKKKKTFWLQSKNNIKCLQF